MCLLVEIDRLCGLVVRVSAKLAEIMGSNPGWVIPDLKMVLAAFLLGTQHYKKEVGE